MDETGSFRMGAGVRLGNAWDFGILYSGLQVDSKQERLITYNTSYNIFNLHVGTFYSGFNYADTKADFSYDVVDFEAGYTLSLGAANLRFVAGVRAAYLEHVRDSNFYEGGTTGITERTIEQWGIGPRLGIEGAIPLGSSDFFLTASGNGSVLFGEREMVDAFKGNFMSGGVSIFTRMDDSHTMYNADAELGIGYGVEMGNSRSFLITLGYRREAWWDVTDTSTNAPTKVGDNDEDQVFHGPFLRGTINF